jgi:hypothetical protein
VNLVTVGYIGAGATEIVADVIQSGWMPIVNIRLLTDYEAIDPPGFPARPPAGAANSWYPQTILSGTTHEFFACEANALIAAGAGELA